MAARRPSASSTDTHEYDVSHGLDANPNVFDDEYAASFAPSSRSPSIAPDNARRPSPNLPAQISPPSDPVISPISPSSRLSEDIIPPTRQSVRKSRSFAREETSSDSDATLTGETSTAPHNVAMPGVSALAHRTMSSASSFSFARSQSPNQGDEPSHPYGMYPQGLGVSRSASVATASTATGVGRGYSHRTPAHPYALYPQGVGLEGTDGNETSAIPVGFPGLNTQFHRRLGPEGEEQDIVGVDGHTEQLPPYTRYPEEQSPKFGGARTLPAIGETMADRPTGQESAVDLDETSTMGQHRQRSQDHVLSPESSAEGSSPPTSRNEKSWNEKTWREKRKTKIFGMPLWVLICLFVLIIIIACVTGAVVGAFVGKNVEQDSMPPQNESTTSDLPQVSTIITYYDAKPTQAPTDYPDLSNGTYEVVLGLNPVKGYNKCINTQWQSSAWNCTLTQPSIDFVIGRTPTNWTVEVPHPTDAPLRYGPQIPDIPAQNLTVAVDLGDLELNPAYHFQTTYDKLVIIPEAWLHPSNPDPSYKPMSNRERNIGDLVDTVYDFPWYCYWDDTFIEGFIFMLQNVVVSIDSPPVNNPAFSSFSATTAATQSISSYTAASPTPPPPVGSSAMSLSSAPSPTPDPDSGSYSSSSQYRRRAAPTHHRRDAANYGYQKTPDFTKLVKIEERRLPPNPQASYTGPSCTKMHFGRGSTKPTPFPIPNTNGQLYIVNLDEHSPQPLQWEQPMQNGALSRWPPNYRASPWSGGDPPNYAPPAYDPPAYGPPLAERQIDYNGDGDPYGKYQRSMWENGCYCRWENEKRPGQ